MTLGFFTRGKHERSSARVGGSSVGRQGVGIPKKNPKQVQAEKDGKIPYEYLVLSVLEDDAYVHKHGGEKYGKRNWTIDDILASTYVGAMFRHYKAWCDGEDLDPDSGRPHLTHLRACCAVVLDAIKHDKLIDDRLFAEAKEPDGVMLDETTPISEIKYDDETPLGTHDHDEVWSDESDSPVFVVLEGVYSGGPVCNVRGYGPFLTSDVAKAYARVRLRSGNKNHCTILEVHPSHIPHMRNLQC